MATVFGKFQGYVERWCSRCGEINHDRRTNPRFFLCNGYVALGADEFLKKARPECSPCVNFDRTRYKGNGNENFVYYDVSLYFCVRCRRIGDEWDEDEALEEADRLADMFAATVEREREMYDFLRFAECRRGTSVPRFHDGWMAMSMVVRVWEGVNWCLGEGIVEGENDGR